MMCMKKLISMIFIGVTCLTYGQTLRDINYNYLYSPEQDFSFYLRPVKQGDQWKIFYSLQLKDTTVVSTTYTIQWESRESIIDKQGSAFTPSDNQASRTNTV